MKTYWRIDDDDKADKKKSDAGQGRSYMASDMCALSILKAAQLATVSQT